MTDRKHDGEAVTDRKAAIKNVFFQLIATEALIRARADRIADEAVRGELLAQVDRLKEALDMVDKCLT